MTIAPLDNPGSSSNDPGRLSPSPTWLPIAGILVGLSLVGFSLFVDKNLCSGGIRVVFCIGAALILSGFGTQASGRWNNITLAGAGALALLICGFVYMQEKQNVYCLHKRAQSPLQVQSVYAQIVPQEEKPDGWVYVGINFSKAGLNFGQNWDEKHFTWDGDKERRPQEGDTLTATGSVNLRKDHIHFRKGEGWVNAEVLDVIRRDTKVKVLATKTVADGFHWAKITKIQIKFAE